MVTYIGRDGWTPVPRPRKLAPLIGSGLRGIAIHWPGSARPLGPSPTLAQSAARLESYRRLHTDPPPKGRGWADIAYNVAVDQAGRVLDLRGIGHRSAANGDADVNRSHAAVLVMVGAGEAPTVEAVEAVEAWRRDVWLTRWPHATQVVGHRDLHETECPGGPLYALVQSGRWAGTHGEEGDVPISDEDVEKIARRTVELLAGRDSIHPVTVEPGTGEWTLPDGRGAITWSTALRRVLDAVTR